MISNEDYFCISALDSDKKGQYLKENHQQAAKTFLNLLSHVSKDTTIQYILVMIDDLLQVFLSEFLGITDSETIGFVGGSQSRRNLP
jgi:hypothetical protein